jgi:fermentation-respiration switch protein FrsA (DUF1100 family)
VIVLEIVFLAIFWAWVFSAALFLRNTVLPRLPLTVSPDALSLPSETVRFRATDGLLLEGWKIPGQADRPWLILCHGVGSNRADLLDIAAGLHAAGFNLLLFDFRAHGASAGRVTSFGWQEQRDLEGALAFLGQQPDVSATPYGVYGISMGGAVALMVAARDERLGAVAADSPYSTLEDSLSRHLTLLYPVLPRVPFLWFVVTTYRLRFGVWPRAVSPQQSAAWLSSRALLLIQGGEDSRMPVEETRRIFAAAGEPKALWVIDGAQHLEGYSLNPQAYQDRLIQFFQAHLK